MLRPSPNHGTLWLPNDEMNCMEIYGHCYRSPQRAGISCIHTLLQKALLSWADYVTRVPETGKRPVGGQNKPPSQALTSMSPTGKPVSRIDPCGGVDPMITPMIHTGARTVVETQSRRLGKSVLHTRKTSADSGTPRGHHTSLEPKSERANFSQQILDCFQSPTFASIGVYNAMLQTCDFRLCFFKAKTYR